MILDLLTLSANTHEAVVQPIASERLTGIGLRLRQLVLMVRKLQIEAAAMDIERLAQEFHAHRRAFDVPAGPARSPRAVPLWLARLGGFPQGEIAGVALLVA